MLLFDIKRYAINDGPGIRVTIFMKGCPLACVWCHNPEGISPRAEKLYTRKKCIGCGACVDVCPTGALTLTEAGRTCGRCAEVCPTLAMEMSGREYSIDEVMREIEKETVFMDRSEGGVTFCGGEPLSHPSDLVALLDRCGALGIHRAVDTTLFASPDTVRSVMERTDLFLVDLKHMDSGSHRRFTGVPNERILSNLRMIAEAGMKEPLTVEQVLEIIQRFLAFYRQTFEFDLQTIEKRIKQMDKENALLKQCMEWTMEVE